MTLILPRLADMYSARDLAEHFNRLGRIPPRLLLATMHVVTYFVVVPQLVRLLDGDVALRLRDGALVIEPPTNEGTRP